MVDLSRLTEITHELAEDIKNRKFGDCLRFVTFLLDNIDTHIVILDEDCKVIFANKFARDNIKIDYLNKTPRELGMCKSFDCKVCPFSSSMAGKKVISRTFTSKTGKKMRMLCLPLLYNGSSGVIVILEDAR